MTEYYIDLSSFSVEADTEEQAMEEAERILKCQCGRHTEAEICEIIKQTSR